LSYQYEIICKIWFYY